MFRKAGGGGFLHGENGAIVGLKFDTTKFTSDAGKAYHKVSAELSILRDGQEEPVSQFLDAGFFYPDSASISKDGMSLESEDPRPILQDNTEFSTFVQSAIEAGFSEIPEEGRDFSSLVNQRFTFEKRVNVERQMAAGRKKLGPAKAKAATDEEIMKAGRRQDRNDKTKFYNHDMLAVSAVLGAQAPTGKVSKASKAAPAAKGKSKAAPAEDESAVSMKQADKVLKAILKEAKNNTVKRTQLNSLVARYALENDVEDEERDALRKAINDDDYLADAVERELIEYDEDANGQPISLA